MRIFVIKRKGATIWYNFCDGLIELSDGKELNCGRFFLRKKDAKAYLDTWENKDYFEVVGATVDNKDNPDRDENGRI